MSKNCDDIASEGLAEPPSEYKPETPLYGRSKRSSEFTSENHKLELSNLPKKCKYHVVRQLLERHFKLNFHKVRVGDGKAFIAFLSEKERDEAIIKLHDQEWKGRTLDAKVATARYDPLVKRLKTDADGEDKCSPERVVTEDDVNSKVCPLWNKPYEVQLRIKEADMQHVLDMARQLGKICPSLQKDAPKLFEWTQKNKKICCRFDGVVPSPSVTGYRNKCEFNVGRDGVLGFRMGRYKDNSEHVMKPPSNCPIISETMFKILKTFQSFLLDHSGTKLRGFDHVTHEGHVRQLTVRTNKDEECLIIIDIHPQDLDQEILDQEIKNVIALFETHSHIVSIFFNLSQKNHYNDAEQTLRLVHGQSHLYEYLEIKPGSPLKFRIGPTSFFQVNTKAAELLYRSIIDLAQLNSESLVLDVGCGTGTISISLAEKVGYVIGIDIVSSAIDDAKTNAKENNIANVTFFAGKAEDLINESITILKGKFEDQNKVGDIVAIVDPPRTGFNNSFIKSLRASNIKKIIYVACDPKANTNLISLCRPTSKAYQGDPFVPIRAKAFDLFPHTRFCELVLVYERLCETHLLAI